MFFTHKRFSALFTWRNVHRAAWSIAKLSNWPAALAGCLWRRQVGEIEFRDGLRFKVDAQSTDYAILYEVFGEHIYDRHFGDIDPAGTILDIGGNIGTFTVRAARDLVPRGKVITIEPNPSSLSLLTEHLSMNHLDNVRLIQSAVATGEEPVSLHFARDSGNDSLFPKEGAKQDRTVSVSAISGKDALRLSDAYELVKVDCEGGEFALLYETGPEDWAGTKRIAMEYHLGFDRKYAVNAGQLRGRIEELGFTILAAVPGSETLGYIAAARA